MYKDRMLNEKLFKRGNIVWVDLPDYGNHIQCGKRKAIIISNDWNNKYCPNIHIIPLTTKKKNFKLHIPRASGEYILIEQIMVVSKSVVLKEEPIETVLPKEWSLIEDYLAVQMGFKDWKEINYNGKND